MLRATALQQETLDKIVTTNYLIDQSYFPKTSLKELAQFKSWVECIQGKGNR